MSPMRSLASSLALGALVLPLACLAVTLTLSSGCSGQGGAAATNPTDAGVSSDGSVAAPTEGGGPIPDAGGIDGATTTAPLTRARVFFSGHSLLDNPMPDYVEAIATSKGKDFDWNQQNIPGSPLRVRTWGNGGWEGYRQGKNRNGNGADVVEELEAPKTLGAGELYDTLLVTERHDILGTIEWENTVGYLRHYHDRLIDGNPQGITYFYQTWLDIDKGAPASWIASEAKALIAWECVSSKVNHTLEGAGRPDRVRTLPGGAALVGLVERILAGDVPGITGTPTERLNRIFSDNVHLTQLGAYFMASVHHASIFHDSPVGAAGAPAADAATVQDLQAFAWSFVSTYYAQPNAGTRTMADCRVRIPQEVCAGFWARLGQPGQTAGCQSYYGNANPGADGHPFVWPDPNFTPLPAP